MKMLSIAAVAFAFTGIASAVEDSTSKPVQTSSQAEQEGKPVGTQVETSGKVVSMHSAPMVGLPDAHMLVKLETEQGDTEIVDLGSAAELKTSGIEPKQGQQLWVDGRVGKINDKFLIVAEHLSEGKVVSITRNSPLREETVKHAEARSDGKDVNAAKNVSATKDVNASRDANPSKDVTAAKTESVDAGQQVRTVEGTVIHTRHIKIEGEADEHVLAKLKTANGIAVIDLGTCPKMPNSVNLTEGQPLAATGIVGQLNGKPIILADSVGNLSPIQRTAEREALPISTRPAAPVK